MIQGTGDGRNHVIHISARGLNDCLFVPLSAAEIIDLMSAIAWSFAPCFLALPQGCTPFAWYERSEARSTVSGRTHRNPRGETEGREAPGPPWLGYAAAACTSASSRRA